MKSNMKKIILSMLMATSVLTANGIEDLEVEKNNIIILILKISSFTLF